MKQTQNLSRREMILASGIIVGGISQGSTVYGHSEDEQKELIFRTTDPRNAEPELGDLIKSWLTPTKYFYVRSHAPNPKIDVDKYRLGVEGMVTQELSLSMEDIRRLKKYEITATLTCAGNRRAEYNKEGKVGGVQWDAGAIGNATWGGARLADVLKAAGVSEKAKHVWFEGLDEIPKSGKIIPFGASIPVEKAMSTESDVGALLAYEMNGKPLTADHGYPLRTLVPGYIGARSVKWIGKIILSDKTSPNHYLANAYKIVKNTEAIDWTEAGPIYRFPINGAIGSHGKNAKLATGQVEVSGYVLPTGVTGAEVTTVNLSADNGKSWIKASLQGDKGEFCWQLWSAKLNIQRSTKQIIVRARDSAGGFMPARVPWNAKGYLQNSWYRLPVEVE